MEESLYRRIACELAQQIVVGILVPGSLLPVEMKLCRTWQVNRHTMREALGKLIEQGLILRRKDAGTRTHEPKIDGVNHLLSHLGDPLLLAKNNPRVIKKIDEIAANIESSQMISCPPGSHWLRIASTCGDAQDPDVPIYWTDSYASTNCVKLRTYIRDDPHSLTSGLTETHYGIKSYEMHQTITAISMPKKVAEILSVAPDSPAMRIIRHYLDRDGKVSETMIPIHPVG